LANALRKIIQENTNTVSDGEGVAMVLLWTFLMDHAKCERLQLETLAREQLEAFIKYAETNIEMVREH
jgi:hypothetical protein